MFWLFVVPGRKKPIFGSDSFVTGPPAQNIPALDTSPFLLQASSAVLSESPHFMYIAATPAHYTSCLHLRAVAFLVPLATNQTKKKERKEERRKKKEERRKFYRQHGVTNRYRHDRYTVSNDCIETRLSDSSETLSPSSPALIRRKMLLSVH